MLLILGAVVALISVGVGAKVWAASGTNGNELGCMSEQWLAEQRASHSG